MDTVETKIENKPTFKDISEAPNGEEVRVVAVVPKDIHFVLEISASSLIKIKDLADHSHIDYDGEKEPHMPDAIEFLNKVWYPFLKEAEKYLQNKSG